MSHTAGKFCTVDINSDKKLLSLCLFSTSWSTFVLQGCWSLISIKDWTDTAAELFDSSLNPLVHIWWECCNFTEKQYSLTIGFSKEFVKVSAYHDSLIEDSWNWRPSNVPNLFNLFWMQEQEINNMEKIGSVLYF